MRIFIGIQFNNDVKTYLNEAQQVVKEIATCGNFTLFQNFHLTLRFLGELTETQIIKLKNDLSSVKMEPFTITIGNLNSFQRNNKHIVYVDCLKGVRKLESLVKLIDERISFEPDTRFTPHITIAREVSLNKAIGIFKEYPYPINVDSFSIMLSHRVNNELTYTPLTTICLK